MSTDEPNSLTPDELAQEGVTALPDKEVVSILDLAADVDLAIDGAAPIDLAVALNANVVAPIDAAVSANVLSDGSSAQALADQGVQVTQSVDADAVATGTQDSTIDQGDAVPAGTVGEEPQAELGATTTETSDGTVVSDPVGGVTDAVDGVDTGALLAGPLLNVDVDVDLDADLAAPINGAVAANANVAAPIDAAVATNILSDGSEAVAVADQDAIITQSITGSAEATSDQTSTIDQGDDAAGAEEPPAPADPTP